MGLYTVPYNVTLGTGLFDQDEIIFDKGKYTFLGRLNDLQLNAAFKSDIEHDLF